MAALPYLQFYVADYKADTEHLTTVEHGAYLLLIMTYWTTGKPLPDNDRKLAGITRLPLADWLEMRPAIADFFKVGNGVWCHGRLERDLARVRGRAEQAAQAGKRSGEARKAAKKQPDIPKQKQQVPNDRSTDVAVSLNETPTREDKDKDKDKEEVGSIEPTESDKSDSPARDAAGACDGVAALAEAYTQQFESWWAAYPSKTGKRAASNAYKGAVGRLRAAGASAPAAHGGLLKAAQAYAAVIASKGTEARYVPHGATWLNQSRYLDEQVQRAMGSPPKPKQDKFAGTVVTPATPAPAKRETRKATAVGWVPDADG